MSLRNSGQYYHEVLKRIPPRSLPAFESPEMQERVWVAAGASTTTWERCGRSSCTGRATRSGS